MKRLLTAAAIWLATTVLASAQIVTGSEPYVFVNGTVIDATQVNADYTYIINQINANGAKNGVNSDITALAALTTPLSPTQSGTNIYYAGTSTGVANAQVVSAPVPAFFTLAAGKTIRFIAGFTNTAATTLAVNGTAATAVFRQTPAGIVALTGNEIVAGALIEAYYDGVQFQLLTNPIENGGFGQLTALAGSATPDLGLVPGHNVNLTGGPFTITSFGTSATATYPLYLVRYNAANILTQSATLNLLGGLTRLTASGDVALYLYSAGAWYEQAYFPASIKYGPTSVNALTVKNNAITPATQVDITAAEVVMDSAGGGNYYTDNFGTCTVILSINGAGGLDTGVVAAGTWYHFYAISTGIANSCIASVSATAPTMPAGYTYKVRVGANKTTAATATLMPVRQEGQKAQFSGIPVLTDILLTAPGAYGTCTAAAQTLVASPTVWGVFVPPTAKAALLTLVTEGASIVCAAPVPMTTGINGFGVPTCVTGIAGAAISATTEINYMGNNTVGYCNNTALAPANLVSAGWVDRVNAN